MFAQVVIGNGYAEALRAVSEESRDILMFNILRFFAALKMTKNPDCHFEGGTTGKSPEKGLFAWEISPTGRNDNKGWGISPCGRNDNKGWGISPCGRNDNKGWGISPDGRNDNMDAQNDYLILTKLLLFNKGLKSILLLFLVAFVLSTTPAQNIMQINNVQGVINSTVAVPISIKNDEEFISFQCDILLPDSFNYIPGSIILAPRSVDHVVSVTNIGNNTIRILSYSLNNTPFLLDSGIVANFSLTTPATEGDYIIGINNAIIGNPESVNILDSIVVGEIKLAPIGVSENSLLESRIRCFPVPFNETLTIQFEAVRRQSVSIRVFSVNGMLLGNHELEVSNLGINDFSFHTHDLLGNNPSNGSYFINFGFRDGNQVYSIVKKIQLNK